MITCGTPGLMQTERAGNYSIVIETKWGIDSVALKSMLKSWFRVLASTSLPPPAIQQLLDHASHP